MRYVMTTGADCMVSCSSELRKELADILGPGHIQLTARSRKIANNSQSTGR